MYEQAGQANSAHLLSTFTAPDVSSDGDAFPINRKKPLAFGQNTLVSPLQDVSPTSSQTLQTQTGTLAKPSVKTLREPLSSFCCVSNAQCCT